MLEKKSFPLFSGHTKKKKRGNVQMGLIQILIAFSIFWLLFFGLFKLIEVVTQMKFANVVDSRLLSRPLLGCKWYFNISWVYRVVYTTPKCSFFHLEQEIPKVFFLLVFFGCFSWHLILCHSVSYFIMDNYIKMDSSSTGTSADPYCT
jgi:hypothetical protein